MGYDIKPITGVDFRIDKDTGALLVSTAPATAFINAPVDLAASGNIVANSVADTQVWVYGLYLRSGGLGTLSLQDDADTPVKLTPAMNIGTNDLVFFPKVTDEPYKKFTSAKNFETTLTGGATAKGWVVYRLVNVS